jgi:asparagine synthetase B (glutamine-hydrolysing)
MHPHNTEMDLSIASALYFACRGRGHIYDKAQIKREYTTRARALLSGLGADELFGGYSRHAIAFGRRGAAALIDELTLDFERLGKRNLGRDDRVTAHWGREVRYPFLDEDLVAWAVAAPVWEKCGFGASVEPRLEPGKLVLRLLAWKCGLEKIASEKKRAVGTDVQHTPGADEFRYNSARERPRCTPARREGQTR